MKILNALHYTVFFVIVLHRGTHHPPLLPFQLQHGGMFPGRRSDSAGTFGRRVLECPLSLRAQVWVLMGLLLIRHVLQTWRKNTPADVTSAGGTVFVQTGGGLLPTFSDGLALVELCEQSRVLA